MGNSFSGRKNAQSNATYIVNDSASGGSADPNLVSLLGDTLKSSAGNVRTADALAGKSMVALYFSAHWCPPCRGFTPLLVNAYMKHLKAKGLEIVFVSSDRDEKAFNSYFGEMPWLALPFAARGLKSELSNKYRVSGIPSLILLNSDGSLNTAEGRGRVASDPTGKWLPARAPAPVPTPKAAPPRAGGLDALLGGSEPLLDKDGKTPTSLEAVANNAPLVALYFSAHWCGPCRAFTPKLVTFVEMLEEEGLTLPIIFGSSDRDEASFREYFSSMPWYAFPHGDKRIEALKTKYAVSGIPWLVVLDAQGNLVANEADEDVPMGTPAYQKWLQKASKASATGAPAA